MTETPSTVIKQLLEAGVHFGHQTRKWNPKMKEYIFTEKSGIYIIDLQQTVGALTKACDFLREMAGRGEKILFVGTKKQAQQIIKETAIATGMYYVEQRWLGGFLTNFATIRKSIARLNKLETQQDDGTFKRLSKKEVSQLTKEMNKLKRNLEGTRKMERMPSALFIIDAKNEDIAIKEARKLKIPVVALVDTNCDPDVIDYVIPGNDDAIRSIRIITSMVRDSILDGANKYAAEAASRKAAEEKAAAEAKALAEAAAATAEAKALAQKDKDQAKALAQKDKDQAKTKSGALAVEEAASTIIDDKLEDEAKALAEKVLKGKKEEAAEADKKTKTKFGKATGRK